MRFVVGFVLLIGNLGILRSQPTCTFVGSASSMGGDCYEITSGTPWPGSPAPFEFGAVWFNQQLDLTIPFSIEVEVGLGDDDGGADGIVMVLQTEGPYAIGVGGDGLGFGGIAPSFGVEIDTHFNADNLPNQPFGDISQDHVAFQRDGVIFHDLPYFNLAGPNPALPSGVNIEDGELHGIKLEWDPSTNTIEFHFDCELRLSLNIDLVDEIFNGQTSVWWGFTGATGGLVNQQTACITASAIGLPPEHDICEGEGVELLLQTAEEGTIAWEPPVGLSDPTSATPIASPDMTTNYTVTWTDVCGDELTAETVVTVHPVPEVDLPAEVGYCPGEEVLLQVDVPPGATATWSDGTPGGIWTGTDEGLQSVQVESAGGCTGQGGTEVVALVPDPAELPEVDPLCGGEVVEVVWPAGTDGWTVDGVLTPSPWWAGPGDFALAYVDGATGCGASMEFAIGLIEPETPVLQPSLSTCTGAALVLPLDAGSGAAVSWSPSTGLDDPSIEQPMASPPATLSYSATVTDICGVQTVLTTEVTVFDTPDAGLPDTVSLCPGQWAELNIVPVGGLPAPVWSDGSDGWDWIGDEGGWISVTISPLPDCQGTDSTFVQAHVPTSPSFEVDPLCPGAMLFVPWPDGWSDWEVDGTAADPSGISVTSSGVYFLVATEEPTGCDVVASLVVPDGALYPMSLPDVVELCEDQALTLNAGVPDPVYWNDGETGAVRVVREPGLYRASHTTDCGTVTDSTLVVEVPCGCAVFAPSAFTPDGDLINDAWRPSFECEPDEYHLQIFSRWGQEIWQSNNPEEYWTGGVRPDGRPLDQKLYYVRDGVYAFQLTYRDPTSVVRKMIRKTGNIMVLR